MSWVILPGASPEMTLNTKPALKKKKNTRMYNVAVRDAIIKENPVISGFLQIGGRGLRDHLIQIFYM